MTQIFFNTCGNDFISISSQSVDCSFPGLAWLRYLFVCRFFFYSIWCWPLHKQKERQLHLVRWRKLSDTVSRCAKCMKDITNVKVMRSKIAKNCLLKVVELSSFAFVFLVWDFNYGFVLMSHFVVANRRVSYFCCCFVNYVWVCRFFWLLFVFCAPKCADLSFFSLDYSSSSLQWFVLLWEVFSIFRAMNRHSPRNIWSACL